VKRLIPSKEEKELDIKMIGGIRDTIHPWLVDRYKIVEESESYP
jgi:hypothetical protein